MGIITIGRPLSLFIHFLGRRRGVGGGGGAAYLKQKKRVETNVELYKSEDRGIGSP